MSGAFNMRWLKRRYGADNKISAEEAALGSGADVNWVTLNNLQKFRFGVDPEILLFISFKMETQELKKLVAAIAEEFWASGCFWNNQIRNHLLALLKND